MKIFKRNFLFICIVFLFISNIGVLAQKQSSPVQLKTEIKGDNLTTISSPNVDPSLELKIETKYRYMFLS